MKSITKATAAGLLATVFATFGTPSYAATEEGFPDIAGAPSWYAAAPEAPYATVDMTASDQFSVQDEEQWFANAWWYDPQGGSPQSNDPDITIENVPRSPGEVGATDPGLITISINDAFPELVESLGTELTTGVVLPSQESATPTVRFPGAGVVVVQRPARDCLVTNDIKDPDNFWINVAMLGENQHKYLVALNLEFGLRTWKDACAGAAVPAAPAPSAAPAEPASTEEPKDAGSAAPQAPEKPTQDEATADGAAPPDDKGPLTAILVVSVVGLIGLLFFLFRRRPTHGNDGKPIQRPGASQPDEYPRASSQLGRRESGR